MLVAIHGFKQAGKDTLARLLVREFGFAQLALADRLKEVLALLFGIDRSLLWGKDAQKQSLTPVRWKDLCGIDRVQKFHPEFLTVRELMQIFATEICREKIPGLWYQFLPYERHLRLVVSDIRFENEARYIKKRGAVLIHVIRPGVSGGQHPSEAGIPAELIDHELLNDGTVEAFEDRARKMFVRLGA